MTSINLSLVTQWKIVKLIFMYTYICSLPDERQTSRNVWSFRTTKMKTKETPPFLCFYYLVMRLSHDANEFTIFTMLFNVIIAAIYFVYSMMNCN